MQLSILLSILLGAPAWAAPAGNLSGRSGSDHLQCYRDCVMGCGPVPSCQAVCNITCANAGEAEEATALAAREAESSVGNSFVSRSNYVECHQNCVRGCTGNPSICQAVCNAACANAGEAEE